MAGFADPMTVPTRTNHRRLRTHGAVDKSNYGGTDRQSTSLPPDFGASAKWKRRSTSITNLNNLKLCLGMNGLFKTPQWRDGELRRSDKLFGGRGGRHGDLGKLDPALSLPSFLPIGGSLCPAPPITVRMRERERRGQNGHCRRRRRRCSEVR